MKEDLFWRGMLALVVFHFEGFREFRSLVLGSCGENCGSAAGWNGS